MYALKYISKRQLPQLICLSVIALIMHAIVLKFIFPGYYSPLYPHHSDFYIPVALANSPDDFFQYRYLGYSRPLGMFFLKLIGFLGVHGAILFTIINVFINAAMSAIIVKRVLKIEFNWKFIVCFSAYSCFLFSQSYFYTFYTQDVFSHLSYFLLLTGAFFFYIFHTTRIILAYILLFIFSIVAFLCKETYALTAIFIVFIYFLYNKRQSVKIAIRPLLIIAGALILVMTFNLFIKSIFINFSNAPGDPYYIKLSPYSVLKELFIYAREGLNIVNWMLILLMVIILIICFRNNNKKAAYTITACIIGSFLSWLPNALIPNHHNGGYSFAGAYLLYLPVVFIPLLSTGKTNSFSLVIMILILSAINPLLNRKEYVKQWWVLEQENSQRNLLHSFDTLMNNIKPGAERKRILVTGLRMPFYPFHHPLALKDYKNFKFADFDVVDYSATQGNERYQSVLFISPKTDLSISGYNEIWIFAGDGKLIRELALDHSIAEKIERNKAQELILFPDSTKNEQLSLIIK